MAVTSKQGTCVAVGSAIQTSQDGGQSWQVACSWEVPPLPSRPPKFFFSAVCAGRDSAGNNLFVAVGNAGQDSRRYLYSAVSRDGLSWKSNKIGRGNEYFYSVTYGRGVFVAVSSTRRFYTSRDGLHWTRSPYQAADDLYMIVFGQNLFVAVGDHGNIYASYDGVSWTVRNIGFREPLRRIYCCGDTFVIVTSPYSASMLYQSAAPSEYMLEIEHEGYGSVSVQPADVRSLARWSGSFPKGTIVTLEAHGEDVLASVPTVFDAWTGLDANNLLAQSQVNPVTFEINANVHVTAHFAIFKPKPPKLPELPKLEMAELQ